MCFENDFDHMPKSSLDNGINCAPFFNVKFFQIFIVMEAVRRGKLEAKLVEFMIAVELMIATRSRVQTFLVFCVLQANGEGFTFTKLAMIGAAAGGHLEMIKWLNEKEVESTTEAMDRAAQGGHLDVVEVSLLLLRNTSVGNDCTARLCSLLRSFDVRKGNRKSTNLLDFFPRADFI